MTDAPGALRLGLLGLGGAAMQMLPTLIVHPRVRLAACTDLNAEASQRFAADFGARSYDSVETLCADPDIDAVYIATPHQFHRSHAVMAADAGKHIIVEKPMALTLADCDAMIEAAERNSVRMVVGHTHSFDPPVMKMREIIASRALGPVAMINSFSYGNFLYRPRRPEELDTEKGGGIVFNQVPHQVDVARYLSGGLLRSVRSMAWQLDPKRPTEGSYATFLQFDDGAAAMLTYSGYDHFDSDEFNDWIGELGEQRKPEHGAARAVLRSVDTAEAEAALKGSRVYGGKPKVAPGMHHPHCGITIVSCARGDLRATPDGVTVYGMHGKQDILVPPGPAFPDKSPVIDELCDAVACGREAIRNGRWGKATMEASLAVLESAKTRQEITLRYQVPVPQDVPPA